MVLLSSRSYIKLHALFQLVLAAYLTNSREVITDDELVFSARDGKLRINDIPTFTRPRSPFAYCGILLVLFAVFDLTLAIKLPTLNHLLAVARYIRNTATASSGFGSGSSRSGSGSGSRRGAAAAAAWSPAVRKITAEFTDLYRHICILLMTLRCCVFMIVTMRIFLSPAEVWRGAVAPVAASAGVGASAGWTDVVVGATGVRMSLWMDTGVDMAADLTTPADELKYKVVLAYGVMEALFSGWVIMALYDEQLATEKSFRLRGGRMVNPLRVEALREYRA